MLNNIVTNNKNITDESRRDLLISMITLKYTQSNSVCFVLDGQVIGVGVGAGQQSRIHCTRLAVSKADIWYLRQHPNVLNLSFKEGISRSNKDNFIDQYLRDDITSVEMKEWGEMLNEIPNKLTKEEKAAWISYLSWVSLGSDAFFPFRDAIVIKACNEYNISMAYSNVKLFHY